MPKRNLWRRERKIKELVRLHYKYHVGGRELALLGKKHGLEFSTIEEECRRIKATCEWCNREKRSLARTIIGKTFTPEKPFQVVTGDHTFFPVSTSGFDCAFTIQVMGDKIL